jgi:peroxiredoxin
MTISVGDKMPEGSFMTMGAEGPAPVTSADLFAGKTVVLFGLPGAFTPTCSAKHLPGYIENAAQLKAKGVDTIACMSVNDAFVMGAWGKEQGAGDAVTMLADGSADYARAMGLELDLSARGMGMRATRFSLLVEDGTVKAVNVEESPAEAVASGAENMLASL